MAGSTISVKITGDSTEFVKAANTAGKASKETAAEVESGLGKLNEGAEQSTRQFRGAADAVDGMTSVLGVFGVNIPGAQVLSFARGMADLADGFATTVGPAIQKIATKFGILGAAEEAETAATEEATVAQEGLNTAFLLSPVGLILVGLAALAAAFVLLWKHCSTFRDIVKATMADAWAAVKKLGDVFISVAGLILEPYKLAFNLIADAWNNTVGRLSFKIPGWVPGIGGDGFSVPQIPHFAAGGVMAAAGFALVGENGPEIVALPGGANVINNHQSTQMSGSGHTVTQVMSGGQDITQFVTSVVWSENRANRNAALSGARRRTA